MKVQHKETGKVYTVYDIAYDKAGFPHFLVYLEERNSWVRMSAKYFKPIL